LKPVLLVIAGPNGAGKTTVTARLRSEQWSEGVDYINPDEVARTGSEIGTPPRRF
jgi:predicted ABC-type ATPase